jgi:hypothetical protein
VSYSPLQEQLIWPPHPSLMVPHSWFPSEPIACAHVFGVQQVWVAFTHS